MSYGQPLTGIPTPEQPENLYEQATAHLTAGQLGHKIDPHIDQYAEAAGMPRRTFLKTACGMAAAMLAVTEATGLRFFAVAQCADYEVLLWPVASAHSDKSR